MLNAAVTPLRHKRSGGLIPDALPVDNPFSLSRGGLFAAAAIATSAAQRLHRQSGSHCPHAVPQYGTVVSQSRFA